MKGAAAVPVAAAGTAATGLKPGTQVQPVAPVVGVPVSSQPIIKEKKVEVNKVEDVTKPVEVPVTKPLTVERVVEVEKVVERKVPVEVEKVVYVDKPVEVIKEVPVVKEVRCMVLGVTRVLRVGAGRGCVSLCSRVSWDVTQSLAEWEC